MANRDDGSDFRVALLDDYQRVALDQANWRSLPDDVQVVAFSDHLSDEEALVERLLAFDAIVAMRERTPVPASLLRQLPSLRLLVTTGARNASIDLESAEAAGIRVCGTRGMRTGTAELTWGLIVSLLRHIPQEDAGVRRGAWQISLGSSPEGKTLGMFGLGSLGSQVAAVGKAFGMEILAWSENLAPDRAEASGVRYATKEDLLAQSDVVSVHLVLSDRPRGLIASDDLARMKPKAVLVNTSRGPIVDEAALVHALQNGGIAGAALDVFDQEPLPSSHLLTQLANVLITPHLGYVTEENYRIFYGDAMEDIRAFLNGDPIRILSAT